MSEQSIEVMFWVEELRRFVDAAITCSNLTERVTEALDRAKQSTAVMELALERIAQEQAQKDCKNCGSEFAEIAKTALHTAREIERYEWQ